MAFLTRSYFFGLPDDSLYVVMIFFRWGSQSRGVRNSLRYSGKCVQVQNCFWQGRHRVDRKRGIGHRTRIRYKFVITGVLIYFLNPIDNWPSDSGDGEEEGEESSKRNEAKKDGDVEPKKDDGAAGILNNSLEPRKSPGKVLARWWSLKGLARPFHSALQCHFIDYPKALVCRAV